MDMPLSKSDEACLYMYLLLLFIILICVLMYNTIAPTVLYNYIYIFSLNRAALKNSILQNCVYPV